MIQASRLLFPSLSLERACQLLGLNRGSYYRHRETLLPPTAARALSEAVSARARTRGARSGWRVPTSVSVAVPSGVTTRRASQ